MIWFSDLLEPVENFVPFFSNPNHKILDVRNVWLLNYRNMGDSDHHESFAMHEISDDIMRFIDRQKLTMVTLGGHGFGAKVALATAISNMDRVTGIINLDGGPVDHKYHEAYHEVRSYVEAANKLDIGKVSMNEAIKHLETHIACQKWRSIFKQNLEEKAGSLTWKCNMEDLGKNMKKNRPDVAIWDEQYGLWPGQALCLFAAHSKWIHMSTNTLPFYNVMPRLQFQFPSESFNMHASGFEGPLNHWLHEGPDSHSVWHLSQRMWRWLKNIDGTHVLLVDKTETGWYNIPDRGFDIE